MAEDTSTIDLDGDELANATPRVALTGARAGVPRT